MVTARRTSCFRCRRWGRRQCRSRRAPVASRLSGSGRAGPPRGGAAGEAGGDFSAVCQPPAGRGVADRAELLVALPGHINFSRRVIGIQAAGQLVLLAFGEVFDAVAEQAADLERVVFVAAVTEGGLLDAAA